MGIKNPFTLAIGFPNWCGEERIRTADLLTASQAIIDFIWSKINSSSSANEVIHQSISHRNLDYKEYFWCFYLTNANNVLCFNEIGCGNATGTVVNTCEVFVTALKKSAVAIILVHNHPSGKLKPSTSDKELTHKIQIFGDLIGIKLLDHLIIASEKNYYSFADEGQLSDNKILF